MASWQTGYIEANGLRLHYTRTGGDKPAMVLAHGITDDGLCWTRVARSMEPDFDVIMVDARGHGRSEAPERGYGLAELATDLAGVIEGLGLERPAILGHSMGAITTLALAGLYPQVPGAILLEDPPAWWVEGPAPGTLERFRSSILANQRMTRDELIAERRREQPRWHEDELGPWADAKLRVSVSVVNRDSPRAIDWPSTLQQVVGPALLITGDPERGAIVTWESAAALSELIPQVVVAPIPGAGHSIHRDQFDRYMDVVSAFLAKTAD
jgi:N-formylmaleamate deformylase